jgi:hypothetical protein
MNTLYVGKHTLSIFSPTFNKGQKSFQRLVLLLVPPTTNPWRWPVIRWAHYILHLVSPILFVSLNTNYITTRVVSAPSRNVNLTLIVTPCEQKKSIRDVQWCNSYHLLSEFFNPNFITRISGCNIYQTFVLMIDMDSSKFQPFMILVMWTSS